MRSSMVSVGPLVTWSGFHYFLSTVHWQWGLWFDPHLRLLAKPDGLESDKEIMSYENHGVIFQWLLQLHLQFFFTLPTELLEWKGVF